MPRVAFVALEHLFQLVLVLTLVLVCWFGWILHCRMAQDKDIGIVSSICT